MLREIFSSYKTGGISPNQSIHIKYTMAEVDKVAILSLENAETWSHFFKQLVGKKAYKKKQSNRKKMVNIEPPTYILKHGENTPYHLIKIEFIVKGLLSTEVLFMLLYMNYCKLPKSITISFF